MKKKEEEEDDTCYADMLCWQPLWQMTIDNDNYTSDDECEQASSRAWSIGSIYTDAQLRDWPAIFTWKKHELGTSIQYNLGQSGYINSVDLGVPKWQVMV